MSEKPILVVMAAGMGSRYGGLKQIDPVGRQGEAILDFSLYDAYEAGFETAVIIIKEAIRQDFMDTVGKRLARCPLEIRYAYQELTKLPAGYSVPAGRTKPWGTSHAVLCAREQIGNAPFVVLNSDDYYGKSAFRTVFNYLSQARDGEKYDYCMVGYELGKTVTDHGSVTRGVCEIGPDGKLAVVNERTSIEKYEGGIHFTTDEGATWEHLDADTLVSMNMWGYTPSFLQELEARFPKFLDELGSSAKAEFLLPVTMSQLLAEGKAQVQVLRTADTWHGVTYAADKPLVMTALEQLTREGQYPAEGLWAAK